MPTPIDLPSYSPKLIMFIICGCIPFSYNLLLLYFPTSIFVMIFCIQYLEQLSEIVFLVMLIYALHCPCQTRAMPREEDALLPKPSEDDRIWLSGGSSEINTRRKWKFFSLSCVWPYTLLLGCSAWWSQVSPSKTQIPPQTSS